MSLYLDAVAVDRDVLTVVVQIISIYGVVHSGVVGDDFIRGVDEISIQIDIDRLDFCSAGSHFNLLSQSGERQIDNGALVDLHPLDLVPPGLDTGRRADDPQYVPLRVGVGGFEKLCHVDYVATAAICRGRAISGSPQRAGYPARLSRANVAGPYRLFDLAHDCCFSFWLSCRFQASILSSSRRSNALTAWLIEHRPARSNARASAYCLSVNFAANFRAISFFLLLVNVFCTFIVHPIHANVKGSKWVIAKK
jgi:hypothetical protein